MSQTKLESAWEIALGIFIKYWISCGAGFIIYPLANVPMPGNKLLLVTLMFSVTSFLVGFGTRRFFNWREENGYAK